MQSDEVEYLVKYNELPTSSPRRLLIRFTNLYAVILLNDDGCLILDRIDSLVGQTFTNTHDVLKLRFENLGIYPKTILKSQKSWVVYYDGTHLIIPTKRVKSEQRLVSVGIVITGKDHIPDNEILASELLKKTQPTPFLEDRWCDSYNDSFYLEPRVIESAPTSVFNAIMSILNSGKLAFYNANYDAAASKYQKAFHYCHSYYPENLEEVDLATAARLKIQSLLNFSLAVSKTSDSNLWTQGIESCELLLGMPESTREHRAKAFYRLGILYLCFKDELMAKEKFQQSLILLDDPATRLGMEKAMKMRNQKSVLLQSKMKKAFE